MKIRIKTVLSAEFSILVKSKGLLLFAKFIINFKVFLASNIKRQQDSKKFRKEDPLKLGKKERIYIIKGK